MAINFSQKTIFLPSDAGERSFTPDEKAQIIAVMQDAYDRSPSRTDGTDAENMFEYWITSLRKQITIKFKKDKFQGYTNGSGLVEIDPDYIKNASYIGLNGTSIRDTLTTALIHELGHALRFYLDDWEKYAGVEGDYRGKNVEFVNKIYEDLGLPKQRSYMAYDNTGNIIKPNYQYTNGTPINAAVALETKLLPAKKTWNSAALGNSKDLLIGGPSANTLQSGAGDDFLFGSGGNDTLLGGAGKDTAVYFGPRSSYKIDEKNGVWTIEGKGSQSSAGKDTLKNIEFAQFDDPIKLGEKKTFKLEKGGLIFQKDVSFVFDTTGSMGSVIASVRAQALSLIDILFADDNDARIGIVGFKDTANGEPSSIILPFTDQDEFADRKSAAIAALNSITIGGGGDTPESAFDGLKLALNGSMGSWRSSASTRRIVLFTDAPVKDGVLAAEVTALAQNMGATIISSSPTLAFAGGSVDTFNLSFSGGSSSVAGRDAEGSDVDLSLFEPTDEPITPDLTPTPIQIFTIFTGPAGTDTAALAQIAKANGGAFLTAPTNDELVKQLLAIINAPPVVQPPMISIANISQTEGNGSTPLTASSNTNNYGFDITLSKPSTETVTVKYTTADGTATAVSDYTAATGTVTFNPGETSKTVNISVKGDTTLELDETFTVSLTDAIGGTIGTATGTGTIVDDDRPVIALAATDARATESKKDPGLFNLTRTGATTQALTVTYTIAGTATNDTDYKHITGTATFKAGSAQTSIEIKPSDDKLYEGSETVILTLNDGGNNYKIDPVAKTGTVIITDDDLPSISLSVTDDKAAETTIGQPTNPGQFTLKRTGITTDALTVNYTLDGSASNGIDYQNLATKVTFAAGSDTATIDIRPIDDQFFEGTETVKLKLAEDSNYTIDGGKSGTIKIADNDRPSDRDAKDLVLKVENLDEINPRIGTRLQTGLEGEVVDLRGFDGRNLQVATVSVGDSMYKSYIGFYAVEDAQGTLSSGLKVGDAGYAEAAIKSALLRSFKTESNPHLHLTGGKILAPVVIANGTFEDYLKRNPQNLASSDVHAYFNYIGANTDRVDHFKLLGDNKFGIEDTYGGGDRDYNDIVYQMTVKS